MREGCEGGKHTTSHGIFIIIFILSKVLDKRLTQGDLRYHIEKPEFFVCYFQKLMSNLVYFGSVCSLSTKNKKYHHILYIIYSKVAFILFTVPYLVPVVYRVSCCMIQKLALLSYIIDKDKDKDLRTAYGDTPCCCCLAC